MSSIEREVVENARINAGVPAHVIPTPLSARNAELETNVDEVAAKLEAMGFDPLDKLVKLVQSGNLTETQEAAVAKWIMPYRYPQKRAVELTGKDGGAIPLVLTRDDVEL